MNAQHLRSLTRRKFLSSTVAAGAAAALGASALRASAADNGEVVVLGWLPYWTPETTALFKDKTGITLRMIGAGTDQEMFTKLKAGGAGEYDLVYANAGWTTIYDQSGLIEPISVGEIAATKDLYSEFVTTPSLPFVKEPGKSLLFYPNMWSPMAAVWLKDVIQPQGDPSWTMFWDKTIPKGTLIFAGGGGDDFLAIGGLAQGISRDKVYAMDAGQLQTVVDSMKELKPFQILAGAEQELRARFRSAKATVGLAPTIGTAALINREASKDIAQAAIPKEGSLGWVDGPMLVKDAKNRANALAFLNFIGSDVEYGKLIFKETGGSPCSRVVTEALLADGGANADMIRIIQADNPVLATKIVMQAPPADPAAYAAAWDNVLAA